MNSLAQNQQIDWNMANYNTKTKVTSFENFDLNRYYKRDKTLQSSNLLQNLSSSYLAQESYQEDNFDNSELKVLNVDGVYYQYTDAYIPTNMQFTPQGRGINGIVGDDDS